VALSRIDEPYLAGASDPSATVFHSGAASVAFLVASAVPARLFTIRGVVDTAINADRVIQLFDAIALPANGAVPLWEIVLEANAGIGEAGDDFAPIKGLAFLTGIVVAASTTKGSLTITAQSEMTFFGALVL